MPLVRLSGLNTGRSERLRATRVALREMQYWRHNGRTSAHSESRDPPAAGFGLLQSAACLLRCAAKHLLSSGQPPSHQGSLPTTHSSPVVQVCVLNPDLLAAWHLVAGHQGCITLQVLPSRVIVIVHLGAQASCCWQMVVAAQVYKCRAVHGLSC